MGLSFKKDLRQNDYLQLDQITKFIVGGVNTFEDLRILFETDVSLHASVKTKFNLKKSRNNQKIEKR